MIDIQFHPQFSVDNATTEYCQDKRCRLENVFAAETSAALLDHIQTQVRFNTAYVKNGQYMSTDRQQLANMSPQEQRELLSLIHEQASKGVGFLYDRHNLSKPAPGLQASDLLQALLVFLNREHTLASMREITGHQDIKWANGQVTRYLPGQFLTRHNDINAIEQRRVAYVISLTEYWHPDWGGLLQFYQQDGTPRDAWSPKYNSICLFDVQHVHAVTHIAPYAKQPRISVTGWFCAA